MSQEETSHLRAEIARLNKIINVLLEQNDAIKTAYSQVMLRFEANNQTDRKTYTNLGLSTSVQPQAPTNLGLSTPTQSQPSAALGLNQATQSQATTNLGLNSLTQSQAPTDLGLSRPLHPESSTGFPLKQETTTLPEQIVPSNSLFASVAHKLEAAGFKYVKSNTRQTAAQLFIHFHNGGNADYAGLQQLTGYSAGGLSKLLITLRKRGFIQRTGYGKYGLTEKGKQILAQAL
ncbi:MAG: hypothetical protein AB7G44_08290 [Bacteroidia bacterium]